MRICRGVYMRPIETRFGHRVELRHAPSWLLAAPNRSAGTVIRALAWLGPNEVEESLDAVLPGLSQEDLDELSAAQAVLSGWMAEPIGRRLARG